MRSSFMALIIGLFFVAGCSSSQDSAILQRLAVEHQLPLFADEDHNYRGTLVVYDVHLYMKPPFYDGDDSLNYQKHVIPSMGYYGRQRIVRHVFDDFFIQYIEQSGLTMGAIAASKDGQVIAEAQLEFYITDDSIQGIRSEEFHYGSGFVLEYYCLAEVEMGTMFKTEVIQEYGRQKNEYFFLWPNLF